MPKTDSDVFCPTSRTAWRQWLKENHHLKQAVWLVYYKKKSNVTSLSWSEAVDEALCFGWIDSTKKTLDAHTFTQFFCKRKPTSTWSKINKGKVEQLIAQGLMMPAGYESIETAKQNGSWTLLDEAEELTIPDDLSTALQTHNGAEDFFLGLSRSAKKAILQWLVLAKQPATRQKRITEIAELAAQKLKPKQFR